MGLGLHNRLIQGCAITRLGAANEQTVRFNGLRNGMDRLICHKTIMTRGCFFGEWEVSFVKR